MNVFVIPSWYPSEAFPSTGIFFREQSRLIAQYRPDWKIGIGLWGSHEPKLWLKASRPLDNLFRAGGKLPLKQRDNMLETNCVEFFTPAFTWTRKLKRGNLKGITEAVEQSLQRHIAYFGKPDLIHAHVAYPAGAIAQALAETHQIPFVITEHMSPFPMPSFRADFRKTLVPPLKAANQVLAVSDALIKRLGEFDIEAKKVSNFIDDSFFVPGIYSSDKLKIVAIGRLEEQKNYPVMLEALRLLKEGIAEFEVKIIGTGFQEKSLKRNAMKLRLDKIEWLGECNQEQVRETLQQSTVLINTSHHENQPVAMLEAMACGVPVISFAWAGAEELILPGLGEVVRSDSLVLAERLQSLANENPYSQESVRKAFETNFGTKKVIGELEEVYKSLV